MNNLSRAGLILTLIVLFSVFPVTADTATVGGDQGWYVIHCNVQLAKVYLDDKYVGETQGGVQGGTLTVPVILPELLQRSFVCRNTATPPSLIRLIKFLIRVDRLICMQP